MEQDGEVARVRVGLIVCVCVCVRVVVFFAVAVFVCCKVFARLDIGARVLVLLL